VCVCACACVCACFCMRPIRFFSGSNTVPPAAPVEDTRVLCRQGRVHFGVLTLGTPATSPSHLPQPPPNHPVAIHQHHPFASPIHPFHPFNPSTKKCSRVRDFGWTPPAAPSWTWSISGRPPSFPVSSFPPSSLPPTRVLPSISQNRAPFLYMKLQLVGCWFLGIILLASRWQVSEPPPPSRSQE
jgi:hypothetical protein